MSRKTTKIIFVCVAVVVLAVAGILLYNKLNEGPIIGRIEYGIKYHLTEIRPTDRFAGATMDNASYFQVNRDKKTGTLYLKDLDATSAPIEFIVTDYKESTKHTIINFEFIIPAGEDTAIQHLQAISTKNFITIKTVEAHAVQDIIKENPEKVEKLEYSVPILIFGKESVK